jgi:DnaJ-class molecular chaperone
MESDNYKLYSVLGVAKNASPDDIRRAYKRLAMEYHPDKNKGNAAAEEKFKEISAAYNVLSDETSRAKYDDIGDANYNNGSGQEVNRGQHDPHDIFEAFFRSRGGPFGAMGHSFEDDIFSFGMGGNGGAGGGNRPHKKAQSIEKTFVFNLDDIYYGINKDLNINIRKFCLKCNKKCSKCDGRGIIQQIRNLGIMQQIFQGSCDNCEGSGITIEGKSGCKTCNGKGIYNEDKKATLIIPKGIDENYKTAFPELGEQPKIPNIKPGDLIIHIKIEEHKHFIRKGNDLYYKTDISFIDSVLGKEIAIPYFKEKIIINTNIFGVISNGKNYLLEGKGMPILNTSNKGNMFIEFAINYPKIKYVAKAGTVPAATALADEKTTEEDKPDKIEQLRTLLNEVFYA